MVQPYPSSAKPVEQQQPAAPPSVLNAVKLMYAGAAISAVSLIVSLADVGGAKAALRREFPKYPTSQINHAFLGFLVVAIISAALGIGLWLLMAWASKQGKAWARITSTVLFLLATISLLSLARGPRTVLTLIFPLLTWLVGGGAVWLLWRPDATAFFNRQRGFV
jgi:hypothetical protein